MWTHSLNDYIYDCECYPNIFTLSVKGVSLGERILYEISDRVNHSQYIIAFLDSLANSGCRMVGFNNLGYDYPLLHHLYENRGADAAMMYQKSQSIFQSNDRFSHVIWPNDQIVPQIDLYKIHHFDNPAKSTSLKMIEFNMRSSTVEDLPYKPGQPLTPEQMDVLIRYNNHDVDKTEDFYVKTLPMIRFREELTEKYQRDFLNHNDTKIGKDYFIMRLEEVNIPCYRKVPGQPRQPIQTPRPQIHLSQAVFPYIRFMYPEFQRLVDWFKQQTITETKGIFKDLSVRIGGFQFDFGTGGIHGSIESQLVTSDNEYVILDLDVASYYPNLAIANRVFPEHLGDDFCDIYEDVFEQRKRHAKGTPENAMLKLALNGVYGDSNNQYSPFYDPLYTMKITINGQLLLCVLAEHIMQIPSLTMVQINTDGLTVRLKREHMHMVDLVMEWWEEFTGLTLESAEYSRMWVRDVNNYIAEYAASGDLKRKGAYEYDRDWHQNQSALIVPKAAEAHLVHGADLDAFIRGHQDIYDFMLRTKVPRSSSLVTVDASNHETLQQNITRYYITHGGQSLVKVMPPLAKKPNEWRRIGICVGWFVTPCNNMASATAPINYDYYIQETHKLTDPF